MGLRGPEKQYDISLRVMLTHSQDEFLDAMAQVQNVSKQEVVRRMIDQMYPYSLVQYADTEEK